MTIEKKQTITISIATGIIASIIFSYILNPIFSFVGGKIVYLTNNVSSSFNNRIYTDIAAGEINYSYYIYQIIMLLVILFTFVFYTTMKDKVKQKKVIDNQKRIALLKRIYDICLAGIFYLNIALLILYVFSTSISKYEIQKRQEFNQEIIFAKPYISSNDYDRINSSFNSMGSFMDYKKTYRKLSEILKERVEVSENKILLRINEKAK